MSPHPHSERPTNVFPPGFLWGAATSSYQVEGAAREDGRALSIWDTFTAERGMDSGEVACDHYHRWPTDADLMAHLGMNAYRFSLAWPRIVPNGTGAVNPAGLAHYDRMVDGLLERGITPVPTLYHWDLPQALQERGGWTSRATSDAFAAYTEICLDALGDRVDTWLTVNEPWVASVLGYRLGLHAPGEEDLRTSLLVAHHLLLAHGAATQRIRERRPFARVGIPLSLFPNYPVTDDPADTAAAWGSDGYTNRWFLDPVLRGRYPADTAELFERLVGPLDWVRPGDLDLIGARPDLIGVNYYTRRRISAAAAEPLPWRVLPAQPGVPVTDSGWEDVPEVFYDLLVRLHRDYDIPLLITENGGVWNAEPGPDGRVRDTGRVRALRAHLLAMSRAIEAGVQVLGYLHWSLLDNLEWAEGYGQRFGLVHVDRETQRRTVKDSARYYAAVIAANRVVDATDGLAGKREDPGWG
ncbi:GH1 family beta-glucosidase [Micromonospora sp. WMMD812]|uniref:GH1 family beta-glucosidase n=1 Tax=Micromonospora sp. WMMD812 TaxID=3015152 RepID=UPI00248B1117|nr:GH1 family beta-glucosidase [Micromonospora sp. WMMD812]WBB69212.1 GH1 family beta-glucosidase [Micromonospora sp. WMMD812]